MQVRLRFLLTKPVKLVYASSAKAKEEQTIDYYNKIKLLII